ncbi:hypothetical protein RS030_71057 [Cryptosporidium xiaoi]|uniref:Uncharacterized protein n=1 Tax=Cryptosporidium xiaoi TaxID=659607 RepID=A0AAV9XTX2_9CRYT
MTQGLNNKKKLPKVKLKERNNKPALPRKEVTYTKKNIVRKGKKIVGIQKIENLLSGAAISAQEHMKHLTNKLK